MSDGIVVQALDTSRLVRSQMKIQRHLRGADPLIDHYRLRDAADINEFISHAWGAVTDLLHPSRTDDMSPGEVSDLVTVLSRLRALETALSDYQHASLSTLSDVTADALGRLSRCSTAADLVRMIPAQAARLGFDRVLFSSVQSGRWHPRSLHSRCSAEWANSQIGSEARAGFQLPSAAAQPHPAHVDAMTMLAHSGREFGFSLWQRSKSKDFWMMPVIHQQRVIGIMHADCYLQDRLASRSEVDALYRFCTQLSVVIVHSATMAEPTIRGFGSEVRRQSSVEKVATVSTLARTHPVQATPSTGAEPEADWCLSQREVEVIALMAEGLTNAQIGRRLTITEGTVKSHVKRILRKTSSSNRAEAVAIWMTSPRLAPCDCRKVHTYDSPIASHPARPAPCGHA
ncbi:MAG TPA: helix-turn-helix transcriptional regulator [Aldersonia sp.]